MGTWIKALTVKGYREEHEMRHKGQALYFSINNLIHKNNDDVRSRKKCKKTACRPISQEKATDVSFSLRFKEKVS